MPPLAALGIAVLLLGAGCGGSIVVADDSGEEWRQMNGHCVRESDDRPLRRVINRVDPELCGRKVKNRPTEYVRVEPPILQESN